MFYWYKVFEAISTKRGVYWISVEKSNDLKSFHFDRNRINHSSRIRSSV